MSTLLAARKAELAPLRARARRLGMTIRSRRGTGYGNYHLHGPDEVRPEYGCGLDSLEVCIASIEAELGDLSAKPSAQRLAEAVDRARARRDEEALARYLASRSLTCEFCGEPEDDGQCYKVGAEEAAQWVHAGCHDGFCRRTREEMEARGYVNGVKLVTRTR